MLNFQTNVTPTNWAEAVFRLLQTLAKSGWQVIARSNGSAVNNTPVSNPFPYSADNIGFTASADLNNNRSWFVVQQPPIIAGSNGGGIDGPHAGTRQLAVQRGASSSQWRVKYSFTGAYTTPASAGTATTTPVQNVALADEVYVRGGGTDASPTFETSFAGTEGSQRLNIFADNGSLTGSISGSVNYTGTIPNPWPYGFYMTLFDNGGTSDVASCWMLDPLVTGTFPTQEVEPFVFYFDAENGNTLEIGSTTRDFNVPNGTFGPKTWFRKGGTSSQFSLAAAAHYVIRIASVGSNQLIDPLNMGSNAQTNADDFLPIMYVRPTADSGLGGYKGMSGFVRYTGRTNSTGQVFSTDQPRDRICMAMVILPWDGSNALV